MIVAPLPSWVFGLSSGYLAEFSERAQAVGPCRVDVVVPAALKYSDEFRRASVIT